MGDGGDTGDQGGFGFDAGGLGDAPSGPSPGGDLSGWGISNGSDSFSPPDNTGFSWDNTGFQSMDPAMSAMDAPGWADQNMSFDAPSDSGQGSWLQNLWQMLNSKTGKVSQMALSLAFPQLAIPMMLGRTAVGIGAGSPGQALGGALGGAVQGAMGPAGALAGIAGIGPSAIGSSIGAGIDANGFGPDSSNNSGVATSAPSSGFGGNFRMPSLSGITDSMGGMDNMMSGLGSMYLGRQAMNGLNGQISNLNSLYSPNSPYAQQMAKTLERQDAASGRRSQYGTRAVELQAALANAASRNAPTLANLYQQQRMARFGQLAGLFQMGRNSNWFGMGNGGAQPAPSNWGWDNTASQTPDPSLGANWDNQNFGFDLGG